MEPASELVIISDQHISEGALDDCDQELGGHLIDFVDSLAARPHSVELVINGDFLDFVQASPSSGRDLEDRTEDNVPLCFTERQSRNKLAAIAAAHPDLFAVLRRFVAARADNRLTILPGNHDADFFWTRVQEDFAALVAMPPQCRFHLQRHYVPEGYPWLWIEHGHQCDPVNNFEARGGECWSVEAPPIFRSRLGEDRLYECTGTRFLIKFLNGLDADYPFVDNVKPFSRFIRIFGASALTPGMAPVKAAFAVAGALRYLAELGLHHRKDVMGVDRKGKEGEHPLAAWYRRASPAAKKAFSTRLDESEFRADLPLAMIFKNSAEFTRLEAHLSNRLDLLDGLGESNASLLGEKSGTLTLKGGFAANETEDLATYAASVATSNSVTTVVMGHTHEPINRPGAHTYLNTGSWTRYYQFDVEEKSRPWKLLKEKSYERFPYRLLYVRAMRDAGAATFETWKERSK